VQKVDSSETSENFYKTTRGHMSKDGNLNEKDSIRVTCLTL
jgi:hypothetical protein